MEFSLKEQSSIPEILPMFVYESSDESSCRTKHKKCEIITADGYCCEKELKDFEKVKDELLKGFRNQKNDELKHEESYENLYNSISTEDIFPKEYIPLRYNISKGISDELFHSLEVEVNFEIVKSSLWKACSIQKKLNLEPQKSIEINSKC